MEKPATIDRFSTYHKVDARPPGITNRYYERMIARGIPVIKDTDDAEDAPKWRGDHSFSSDAASYSLMHFIEPEVANEHPDWGAEKVKTEARERFTKRLAQDLSYERQESAHLESSVQWEPIVTKEGTVELATKYGDGMITLKELWEHTKEYAQSVGNPAAYNAEEERAQMSMQESFINGNATGYVSVLSHPDAVRYVQVWQKNDDGEVESKQIDLYRTTGRDFSADEGRQLVEHLAVFHNSNDRTDHASQTYAHFLVDQSKIHDYNIRLIATSFVRSSERSDHMHQVDHGARARDARFAAERKNFTDLHGYLRKEIHIQIQSVENRFLADSIRQKQEIKHKKTNRHLALITQNEKPHEGVSAQQKIQHPSKEINEVYTPDVLKAALAEWVISRTILEHTKDTPVGPHAALVWISTAAQLRESASIRLYAETTSSKHGGSAERKSQSEKKPSAARKTFETFVLHIHVRAQPIRSFINRIIVRPMMHTFPTAEQQKKISENFKPSTSDVRRRLDIVRKDISKNILRIVAAVGSVVRFRKKETTLSKTKRYDRMVSVSEKGKRPIAVPSLQETQSVPTPEVSFIETGIVILRILHATERKPAPITHTSFLSYNKREQPEVSMSQDVSETPWILLAVLRYLALLKESGIHQITVQYAGKRSTRSKRSHITFTLDPFGYSRAVLFEGLHGRMTI